MKVPQPIAIVSFGAATPEDISICVHGKPRRADEIYCLGEAAYHILTALSEGSALTQRCQILEIPMSSDRTEVISYYEQPATRLMEQQDRGLVCNVVTIGGASTYAAVQYFADRLRQADAEIEIVSGILYYIAAMAASGEGLVRRGEPLLVLSKVFSGSQLHEELSKGVMVVVMKLSHYADIVREVIAEDNYDSIYAEYLDSPDLELFASDHDTFLSRQPIPYFSLIAIRPNRGISE